MSWIVIQLNESAWAVIVFLLPSIALISLRKSFINISMTFYLVTHTFVYIVLWSINLIKRYWALLTILQQTLNLKYLRQVIDLGDHIILVRLEEELSILLNVEWKTARWVYEFLGMLLFHKGRNSSIQVNKLWLLRSFLAYFIIFRWVKLAL